MQKSALVLLSIILVSGCIDTRVPQVLNVTTQISSPYGISPQTLYMNVDTSIQVPIENTRDDVVTIEILQATITTNFKDGSNSIINGETSRLELQPKAISNLYVNFKQIPVKYQIQTNPLRLTPLINSYDVKVRYKGTAKLLFGLIPYSKEDVYTKQLIIDEVKINEDEFLKFG